MAGQDGLRASAARDKDFVGIDTAAMARLIQQMTSASNAITAWLRTNAALPPSVPHTGLRQAAAVESWTRAQQGMLARRRDYAIAHLSKGAADMPRVGTGRLGDRPSRTTAAGAGHAVGHFPDAHAATRAGSADAATIHAALQAHRLVPADVWRRLSADAGDPDYVKGLYARLGPAGTADLIAAALGHEARLAAVRESLGLAGHHLPMTEKWFRELLDEASRKGVHDDVVHVLEHAGLDRRAKVALAHIGLTHLAAAPPEHRFPTPHPPHEAMVRPAATDPEAAAELYARHSEAVHRALAGYPHSTTLERLVAHGTAAHAADAHATAAAHAATAAHAAAAHASDQATTRHAAGAHAAAAVPPSDQATTHHAAADGRGAAAPPTAARDAGRDS
ncbi:hypothetical protein NE236_12145 [Actinoallomurus purpureus]|uniref:hypothetical protein n=1 Tax=Actinoallomurus purpureus TaxID=478114 RepID=UPI0020921E41|nr:hypothetical protein [Actinoallomurus purpureus]MCO6005735.1 hypothetical protein [Actinoallomurus purpureus]